MRRVNFLSATLLLVAGCCVVPREAGDSAAAVGSPAGEVPLGFRVLGATVPAEYDPPVIPAGWAEQAPQTNTNVPAWTQAELDRGYVTFETNYLDQIYPATRPRRAEITGRLRAFSAAGEYEPVTFAICALPGNDLADVAVSVSDLAGGAGKIEAVNIDVRTVRCWPRQTGRLQYTVMPLLLEKRPIVGIPENTTRQYWLTVFVPAGTAGGTYSGTITIAPANRPSRTLALELEVLDVALMTPPIEQGMNYWSVDSATFETLPKEQLYRDITNMKTHGMNAIFVMVGPQVLAHEEDGRIVYDLDPVEFLVETCLGAGMDPIIWNMTVDGIIPTNNPDAPTPGTQEQRNKAFADGFRERGWPLPIASWGDEADAHDSDDSPGGSARTVKAWLAASKAAAPEMKTYTTIVHLKNGDIYNPYVNITAFSSIADDSVIAPARAAGRELWMYSGTSYYGMDAKGDRLYRGLWAAKFGLDGALDWIYFSKSRGIYEDLDGIMYGWVAPGVGGPLPTVGWEGLREGIEDGKYLYTLAEWIKQANASGDPALTAMAASARDYLDSVYAQVDISPCDTGWPIRERSAKMDADVFDEFRHTIAGHIKAIRDALDQAR